MPIFLWKHKQYLKKTWDETARVVGVITMVQEGRDVTLNESESEEQEQERKIFSWTIVGK